MGDPHINQFALEERVNARQAENKASYDRLRVDKARQDTEADERHAARALRILGVIVITVLLVIYLASIWD